MSALGYLDEENMHGRDSELHLVGIQYEVYESGKVIGKTLIETLGTVWIGLQKSGGGIPATKKRAGCREVRKCT